jgi:N-acetylglucosamine kinase-like BadF-type ATPase
VTAAGPGGAHRDRLVLAVDGGNVKTDLALLEAGGELLSVVRGGGSSPDNLGIEGCVEVLAALLESAVRQAGLEPGRRPIAATAQILLAGADLPEERATISARIEQMGWSERLVVDNDTLALLRAGTDRGWGIAVVCGAGINCLGRARDGREVRFLSLGDISGDWGGGGDLGLAALAAAARGADGRDRHTLLETAVSAHFGMSDPLQVSRAVHLGQISRARLAELAPVVLSVSDEDRVAASIVSRLADEVSAFARAALRRLGLTGADPDVILGGGVVMALPQHLLAGIAREVRDLAPNAHVSVAPSEPIVGAALLGLDALAADAMAAARARVELDAAVAALGQRTAPCLTSG